MKKKQIVANLIIEVDADHRACSTEMQAMDYVRSAFLFKPIGNLTDLRVMILNGEAKTAPEEKEEKRDHVVKKYLYKDYEISISRYKPTKDTPKFIACCSNTRVKTKTGHLVACSAGCRSLKVFEEELKKHVDRKAEARERREQKAKQKTD